MATVVGVHGIGQQHKGALTLMEEWAPALQDGVIAAGGEISEVDLTCAFFGGVFRPKGTIRTVGDRQYRPTDIDGGFEAELLRKWWIETARLEPRRVPSPTAELRTSAPNAVQSALRALSRSRFFTGIAESALIGNLKQVSAYFSDNDTRSAAQASIDAVVFPSTTVIVAHSLGSVVAYEALDHYQSMPNWINARTLVTLGSPLGIRNLILDRLVPPPKNNRGAWPGRVERWINVSDDGDVVALEKRLGALFDGNIVDIRVDNGPRVHDVKPYLTAPETGKAILSGLR